MRRGQRKAGRGEAGERAERRNGLAGEFGLDVKKRVKALFTGYGSIFRLILGLCGGADYVACEPTENLRGALCSVSGPAGTGLPHREHGWPCGG